MKATPLALAAILCLTGCHATKSKDASATDQAASATPSIDKASKKSRDTMMGKNMSAQSEHWASSPAMASTAAAPTATKGSGH